jgi:hypothetical protein
MGPLTVSYLMVLAGLRGRWKEVRQSEVENLQQHWVKAFAQGRMPHQPGALSSFDFQRTVEAEK